MARTEFHPQRFPGLGSNRLPGAAGENRTGEARGKRARSHAGGTDMVLRSAGHLGCNLRRYSRICTAAPSATSCGATKTAEEGSALTLQLTEHGSRLLVSWDRRNRAVEAAIAGTLEIEDGERRQQIQLDAEQIRNGVVSYKPNSADLTFRLKLRSKNGENTAAILRSLDSAAPKITGGPAPVKSSRERLPHTARALRAPHRAAPDAPVTALAHTPAPIVREQAPLPPAPVLPSEPVSTAQLTPNYVPELPAVPPLRPASPASAPPAPSPPRPLSQVVPPALPAGLILYKDVQVQIQLTINERRHVIAVRPLPSPEAPNQWLLGAALRAATQWQFQPATLHGRGMKSEHIAIFEFHPKRH